MFVKLWEILHVTALRDETDHQSQQTRLLVYRNIFIRIKVSKYFYLKVEKPNKVTLLFPTQSLTHKSGILSGIMAFYDEQNINPKDR